MNILLLNYFLINFRKLLKKKNPSFTTQNHLPFFMADTVSVFVPNSYYGLRFLPSVGMTTEGRNLQPSPPYPPRLYGARALPRVQHH
jgi:hypothetical protein